MNWRPFGASDFIRSESASFKHGVKLGSGLGWTSLHFVETVHPQLMPVHVFDRCTVGPLCDRLQATGLEAVSIKPSGSDCVIPWEEQVQRSQWIISGFACHGRHIEGNRL